MKEKLKIYSNIDVTTKDQLFKFISQKAQEQKVVVDAEDFYKALLERETFGTTGLENHIAIPHAISHKVLQQFVFVICLKQFIKYETLDQSDVKSVICLAVPKAKQEMHLGVLQQVSIMLLDKNHQEILNTGDVEKISLLFANVKKQLETNKIMELSDENKIVDKSTDGNENDEKQLTPPNLISIKKTLTEAYKHSPNENTNQELAAINAQITETKSEIRVLKKNLKNSKSAIKEKFEQEFNDIKAKIAIEKPISKRTLADFNVKEKQEIADIKLKESDPTKQRTLLGLHYTNTYQDKLRITEKLTGLQTKKETILSEYKTNKKSTHTDFTYQMSFNKQQIVNPKNYLYKYANKFQLILMLLLSIIGLWCIVLGSFGITANSSFITLKNDNIGEIINTLFPSNKEQATIAFNAWLNQPVQTKAYGTSLSTLIFGIIAIVMLIPLKLYKVSNVYFENYAKISVGFGAILLIIVIVLMGITYENINIYQTVSKDASGINTTLKNYFDVSKIYTERAAFKGTDNEFNSYISNMNTLFKTLFGDKLLPDSIWYCKVTEGNYIFNDNLISNAKTITESAAKTTLETLLNVSTTINLDALSIGSCLFTQI